MILFPTDPSGFYCSIEGAAGSGSGAVPPVPASGSGSPPASSPPGGGATSGSGSSGGDGDVGGSTSGVPEADSGADTLSGFEQDDFDSIDLGVRATEDDSGATSTPPAAPAVKTEPPAATVPDAPPPGDQTTLQAAAPAQDGQTASRSPLEDALVGFKANQAELADWSAQNLFALTKEEAEALETDAVSAIPKLMGKVYAQVLPAALNLLRNFVPQMVQQGVQQHTTSTARSQEALNEFYTSNPHLNTKDHGAAVTKWAKAYRQANPKASRKEAIDYVGRAVSFEFNLAPGAAPVAKPVPFAPAHPGARVPPARPSSDPYAGMEDDLD